MASAIPDLTAANTLPSMSFEPPPPALQIKLLSSTAKAPTRGSAFAAGYDLYASKEAVVPARGKVLVDTDISIAVPVNTYGRVAPRSGLASKHSIDVGAGVIDADYRGPVKVLLFNLSDVDFNVAVGERVAQLIVERVSRSFSPVYRSLLTPSDLHTRRRSRRGARNDRAWCRWLRLDRWLWWHPPRPGWDCSCPDMSASHLIAFSKAWRSGNCIIDSVKSDMVHSYVQHGSTYV